MKRARKLCSCIMSDSNESSDSEAYHTAEEEFISCDDVVLLHSSNRETATPEGCEQNGEQENKASVCVGASALPIQQSSISSSIDNLCSENEGAQLRQHGIQTSDWPETQHGLSKGNISQSSFRLSCVTDAQRDARESKPRQQLVSMLKRQDFSGSPYTPIWNLAACGHSQDSIDPNKKEAKNFGEVSGSVNLSGSPMTPAEVSSGARVRTPCSYETLVETSTDSTVLGNISGDTSGRESSSSSPSMSSKSSGESNYKNVNKVPEDKDRSWPDTQLHQESVSYSQGESKSVEGRTQVDETKGEMSQSSTPGNLTAIKPQETANTQQDVPDCHIRELPTPVRNTTAEAAVPAAVPVRTRSFAEVVMSPAKPSALPLQRPGQKRSPLSRTGRTPKKKAKSDKSTPKSKCLVFSRLKQDVAVKNRAENLSGAASKGKIADQPARRPAGANRAGGTGAASKVEIASQAVKRPADPSEAGGRGSGTARKVETADQVVRKPDDTNQSGGSGVGAARNRGVTDRAARRPADRNRMGDSAVGTASKAGVADEAAIRPVNSSRVGSAVDQAVGKAVEICQTVLVQNRPDALVDELCSTPNTSEEEQTEDVRTVISLVKEMQKNACILVEIVKETPHAYVAGKGLGSQYHAIGNSLSAVIQRMSQFCDALDKAPLKRSPEERVGVFSPVDLENLREISAGVDQCSVLSEAFKQGTMAQKGCKIKNRVTNEKQKTGVQIRLIVERLNDSRRRLDQWIATLQPSSCEAQPGSSAAAFPLSTSPPPPKSVTSPVKDTSKKKLPSDRSEILNAQTTVKTDNEMPQHLRTNKSPTSQRSALGPQAVPPKMPSDFVSHSCSPHGQSSCFDSLQAGRSNCDQTGANGESGNSKLFTERRAANDIPAPTIPQRPPVPPIRPAWTGFTNAQQDMSHLQVPVEYKSLLIGHFSRAFAGNTNQVIGNVKQSSIATNSARSRYPNTAAIHTSPQPWKVAEQALAEVPLPTENIGQTGAYSLIDDVITPVISGPDDVDLASYDVSPVGSVSELRSGEESDTIHCPQFGCTVEENTQVCSGKSVISPKQQFVSQKNKYSNMCVSGRETMKRQYDSPYPSDGPERCTNGNVEKLSSVEEAYLDKNVTCANRSMPSPNQGVNGNDRCANVATSKAKRRLKYVDTPEQPGIMGARMQNGAVRNEASETQKELKPKENKFISVSVATMEERSAHQDNHVNDEAMTAKAASPGTKLSVGGVKVRSNHEKGNMESVDAGRSTWKTPLPGIEESPEKVKDKKLHTEEKQQSRVTTATAAKAEDGKGLKNGDSQPGSTALRSPATPTSAVQPGTNASSAEAANRKGSKMGIGDSQPGSLTTKSPVTPTGARHSGSPITPNTPEVRSGPSKSRQGTHGTPNRRRRGKYNYDTVIYRKSINCCCEDVCDYCVP